MKLSRSISSALAQPWAIRAASMAVMCESIAYTKGQALEIEFVSAEEIEPYEIEDGIATIKVEGIIGKKIPPAFAELFGITNVDDIGDLVRAANADNAVEAILLDIDSPGGTVTGVPEVADIIRNSEKQVFAWSDNLMASAAYWIASGASGIFSSGSALVGSIGVFIPIADMRRMYEMAGVEMEIIKAGDLKAANYPGTSISQDQRDDFRQSVEHVFSKFTEFVTARQGANPVGPESMRGQDFYGDQALDVGLVDAVLDKAAVLDALKKLA